MSSSQIGEQLLCLAKVRICASSSFKIGLKSVNECRVQEWLGGLTSLGEILGSNPRSYLLVNFYVIRHILRID